jgi:hypothetical protein
MIRILTTLATAAFALATAACCCTSDSKPPKLRPLPKFQEIEPAYSQEYAPAPSSAPIRGTK